jgi:predicted DNA-binding protein YlxM (UPF0122 family)
MSDTDPITSLADTLYDALYAITPYAEPHFADQAEGLKKAVRAVLAESAPHLENLERKLKLAEESSKTNFWWYVQQKDRANAAEARIAELEKQLREVGHG